MLGLGWTEIMVVAVVALIVIGPKDLPRVLANVGKAFRVVRKMGDDFRKELNKAVALDEMQEIRRSVTEPLKTTAAQIKSATSEIERDYNKQSAEIQREYNKSVQGSGVEPSGAIKPKAGQSDVAGAITEAAAKPAPKAAAPAPSSAPAPSAPAAGGVPKAIVPEPAGPKPAPLAEPVKSSATEA